jgi:anti-sigma regulatory factor (Ser/Thr protein kinase)
MSPGDASSLEVPGEPLPEPRPPFETMAFSDGMLRAVRQWVADRGRAAGLDAFRIADLVLAVNELAANTIRHATGSGTLRLWCEDERLVCEVRDQGHMPDPMIGHRLPDDAPATSRGLYLVNRICDRVEVRSSTEGTSVRVHMDRRPRPEPRQRPIAPA